MPMCDDCFAEWLKWLDYKITSDIKIASGAAYDDTARGVADARRARYEQWRKAVQTQQDLIRSQCLADPEHQKEAA